MFFAVVLTITTLTVRLGQDLERGDHEGGFFVIILLWEVLRHLKGCHTTNKGSDYRIMMCSFSQLALCLVEEGNIKVPVVARVRF